MPDLPTQHDNESLPQCLVITQSCPPLALLRASQQDALPSELAFDVSSHIESCLLCRILLAGLEHTPQPSLTAAERARIRRKLPIAPAAKAGWHWYAATAAAVALIVAGITLFLRQPDSTPAPQPVAQSQAAPVADSAQPSTPQVQIAKLAPPPDLSPALVLRGEASTAQPTAQQLAPAFAAYTQGDYPVAAQRFKLLAQQFPRSETPFLYLGITQLLQNDSHDALPVLTRADSLAHQNNGSQRYDATWYHALAAVAAHATDATTLLENVCFRKQSPYSPQACALRTSTK
jgi:hypothetical protein